MKYQHLTLDQIDHFIEHGYIILRQAIPPAIASQWTDRCYARLGYDRRDPSTWKTPRTHMPGTTQVGVSEFAPVLWESICDLLGGADRVRVPYTLYDGLIFNFGLGADRPWEPPSSDVGGWHKDGDFFRHFLDSPEQGLLTIICWTDMVHRGGGTFIAPDSIGVVARFLADHPEGVEPTSPLWRDLIKQCTRFIELTGRAGDVVVHHPFMLHAASQNVLGVERAITNPPAKLREPMNFNRPDPADFSPVETAILRGLGVDRYDFRPTAPRQAIVPERVKQERKLLEEEKARSIASATVA